MRAPNLTLATTVLAATLTWGPFAVAAPIVFFGEDLNPSETFPLGSTPNASGAESAFLSHLAGVGTEDFDCVCNGIASNGLELAFPGSGGDISATISTPTGDINNTVTMGRFPISGVQYLNANATTLSMTFSDPIAAFGFYGIDIGDYGGELTVTLNHSDGGTTPLAVGNSIGSGGAAPFEGAVLYFGVIDVADPFTSVDFSSSADSDTFAYDDMTIGDSHQVQGTTVPEPSSALLLGVGTFGIVLAGRIRRKRMMRY